jgi:hypothetical protein
LTKNEDEETMTINLPGRSTYPEEKSVLTSGATPLAIAKAGGNQQNIKTSVP